MVQAVKNEICSQCKNCKKYFVEYCDNTTIHGFKYLSEKRTFIEKLFWFIALVISIICLGLMINNIVEKYVTSPVIVSFTTQETPIYTVPFPTITICSKAKISKKYFDYSEVMRKIEENVTITKQEREENNYASLFCNDQLDNAQERDFYYNNTISEEVWDFLNKSKRQFFHQCSWMGQVVKCEEIFTPIITTEGVCYSFNFLNNSVLFRDDVNKYLNFYENNHEFTWDLEKGYSDADTNILNSYPFRALMSGASKSLKVILYTKTSDVDTACASDDSGGFQVSIDIPGKFPHINENYFTVPANSNVAATITPTLITTSDAIKAYHPEKRDCFFQDEKYLKYFKIYTQGNCFLECLTNITLQYCNCVAFYMPRTLDEQICGSGMSKCMLKAQNDYLYHDLLLQTSDEVIDDFGCDCMPICSDINYSLEISQNPWQNIHFIRRKSEEATVNTELLYVEDNETIDVSSLTMFFKRNHIETKQRNEVYGFTDFLSNFGGLLGLFTGFSLLSVTEIVYFLTLRIFGNFRLFGNWYGAADNNE